MRKQKKTRILHRESDQRKALLRSLASSLFLKGRIKTTQSKAKELRSFAEKQITIARKGDVSSRRRLSRHFSDKVVKKLIEEVAPKYKERPGGYTRIMKLGPRQSDGAKMAIIELV